MRYWRSIVRVVQSTVSGIILLIPRVVSFGGVCACVSPATGASVEIVLQHGATIEVMAAAFSPDGRIVAVSGESESIRLWDRALGDLVRDFAGTSGAGHRREVQSGRKIARVVEHGWERQVVGLSRGAAPADVHRSCRQLGAAGGVQSEWPMARAGEFRREVERVGRHERGGWRARFRRRGAATRCGKPGFGWLAALISGRQSPA